MLSREDRILSELIVSSGLATPEAIERGANEIEDATGGGLVDALVAQGTLDAGAGHRLREEAREIAGLLDPGSLEGRTLGEFRLLREIGRGGMGIVYEAEQSSLRRRVALKVLPAGAALDERLAIRFLREARTVARLRHPGIVPVFATGHEQGVLYFAMELIEGESLATRIDRGPLPPRLAAGIAVEVAEALQHAHDEGLVHRDVKPENVLLGSDTRARLADFGLVHEVQGTRLTRTQFVLGTPAYSAPEQVRGAAVDPRSDVYGAGAVLYAMLSGHPPYDGAVPAAVLARLLHEPPPPLTRVAPATEGALIAICERAMAREPDARYSTAGAFADALRRYLADRAEGEPAAFALETKPAGLAVDAAAVVGTVVGPVRPRRRWGRYVALGAAVVIIAVAGRWRLGLPRRDVLAESKPVPASPVGLLEGRFRRFATAPWNKSAIALSPDGERLAYVSLPDGVHGRIYLQRDGEATPLPLASGDAHQQFPAWSPDGKRIAYCSGGRLEIAEVASGAMASTGGSCNGSMSWSPDGRFIVYGDREWPLTRLSVLDIESRTSRLISGPGTAQPNWGQGGRIAYVALRDGQYDLWTLRDDGSDPRRVTDDSAREMSPVWSSIPGRLYYGSNREESFDLWRVDLDVSTGATASAAVQVSRGWFGNSFALSAARSRERLAFVHDVDVPRLWALRLDARFAPSGSPQRLKIDLPFDPGLPQRAPDRDAWIAVVRRGVSESLFRFASQGTASQLTDGLHRDGSPRWSPDGTTIAFHSDRSGRLEIWTVRPNGSELTRISRSATDARSPVWSPDGQQLAYGVAESGVVVMTVSGGAQRALAAREGFEDFEPWSWSSDGTRIAGTSRGIVVLDVLAGTYTRIADFGEGPVWVDGSKALLFTDRDRVFLWDDRGVPEAIWSAEPNRMTSSLSVSPDGHEIYFVSSGSKERVWLLDLDAPIRE